MIYAKKQKTVGGFYNIWKSNYDGSSFHQERICSFFDWDSVVSFFEGYSMIHHVKVEKQEFISGKTILTIKDE